MVRLPQGMRLPGRDVVGRQEGERIIIEPKRRPGKTLREALESLEPLDEELPEIEDLPPDPVDL